jgi:hypothetical protein
MLKPESDDRMHALHAVEQVMFAKWDDILAIEVVPDVARGQCPLGGQEYAAAVFRYARTMALAAKAAAAAARGFEEEAARLAQLADAELTLLKVRRAGNLGSAFFSCRHSCTSVLAGDTPH